MQHAVRAFMHIVLVASLHLRILFFALDNTNRFPFCVRKHARDGFAKSESRILIIPASSLSMGLNMTQQNHAENSSGAVDGQAYPWRLATSATHAVSTGARLMDTSCTSEPEAAAGLGALAGCASFCRLLSFVLLRLGFRCSFILSSADPVTPSRLLVVRLGAMRT